MYDSWVAVLKLFYRYLSTRFSHLISIILQDHDSSFNQTYLRNNTERRREMQSQAHAAFIDLKKAYDRLPKQEV